MSCGTKLRIIVLGEWDVWKQIRDGSVMEREMGLNLKH